MPKTLLAVDDSVTMRKVLEITFSGEDFRVLTAESGQAALDHLAENPSVFLVDASLGGEDGYAVAKELRKRSPQAAIVLLSSRYAPYDQGRGRDAGVDDWADKPFDTQQLIDKVRKVVLAKEAAPPSPAVVPQAAPTPAAAPTPSAATATPAARPAPAHGSPARSGTLIFGEGMNMSPSSAPGALAASIPRPVAVAPAPPVPAAPAAPAAPVSPGAHAPAPAAAPAAVATTAPAAAVHAGQAELASKLSGLGLTSAQTEAVLALSRDVVERVVWEVVPVLAETLIKEEIARLTR